jgi:hypothetical protein
MMADSTFDDLPELQSLQVVSRTADYQVRAKRLFSQSRACG